MSTSEFAKDFSERVLKAQAIVVETAKCSPEDALELMTSSANLDDESLEQVAEEILSGRLHFSPPE
jgi:AmiR/NasT family two-component response regulator